MLRTIKTRTITLKKPSGALGDFAR